MRYSYLNLFRGHKRMFSLYNYAKIKEKDYPRCLDEYFIRNKTSMKHIINSFLKYTRIL